MEYSYAQSPTIPAAFWIIALVVYAYFAYSIQKIADKTGTDNSWMAWVPILNVFLLLQIADKPLWWFLLLLIPLVNIIVTIVVWMKISEARRKASWIGVLMILPFFNLIVPGYLAFSE
jgi:hypothetical protein